MLYLFLQFTHVLVSTEKLNSVQNKDYIFVRFSISRACRHNLNRIVQIQIIKQMADNKHTFESQNEQSRNGQYQHTNDYQPRPYPNDYQTNAYAPPRSHLQGLPFAQSQAGHETPFATYNEPTAAYSTIPGQQIASGSRAQSSANQFLASNVTNQEVVKGESRINYVPYEKKVIEYENRTHVERVPITKKKIRYEERRVMETVPHEVTKTDYYAVEKITQYRKEIIPEKKIQMVQVEKKVKRYEYVPVEKQIVHYPENVDLETAKGQSRMILGDQGINVKKDAEFKPIDSALIYSYSNKHEGKDQMIGYVDQGTSRVLSTAPTHTMPQYQQQEAYYPPPPQPGYSERSAVSTYNYQPFQNVESAQRQAEMRVSSPRLIVTDPTGGMQQELHQPRGSYITELNTFNTSTQEVKRPFENLSKSKARPGITQVKRQSGDKFNDYAVERPSQQGFNSSAPRQSGEYDWKIGN